MRINAVDVRKMARVLRIIDQRHVGDAGGGNRKAVIRYGWGEEVAAAVGWFIGDIDVLELM